MGASWLEIESLLKQLDEVIAFPHAEALMPVTRARDTRGRGRDDRLPGRRLR